MTNHNLPAHYLKCMRTLLRFAAIMTLVGLLSGLLFQESAKKLDHRLVEPGLYGLSTLRLALLHGHVIVTAVLIPIACAMTLLLARRIGGTELGVKPLKWLTRGYLPLIAASLALMLVKSYHVLLAVRGGDTDLVAIDERFFFGLGMVRHVVYGATHIGMAASLGIFMIAIWSSLRRV